MAEKEKIVESLVEFVDNVVYAMGGLDFCSYTVTKDDPDTGLTYEVNRDSTGDINAIAADPSQQRDSVRVRIEAPEFLFKQRG